jgi:NADPH:quinone reductase-like Zn-dependent oxidoreductase
MKAAVLHQFGAPPRYEDFPDPTPGADELLLHVKAVSLENADRAMATGQHYASRQMMPQLPAIAGFDGIGALEDGRLVGFGGLKPPYGSMAERVVIPNGYFVPVPEGVDALTAAAVPAGALTSLFPLKWTAKLQPGETVLVNGATGFSGRLAVQIAKLLGAGRVVGTGRNPASLRALAALGADAVIYLTQPDAQLAEAFTREAGPGCNVILDFLWGHPTEALIQTLIPRELSFAKRRVRLIQIGEIAGPAISLTGDALRTSGLEICGAGAGLTPEAIREGTTMVWDLIRAGKLHADVEAVPLKDIEAAWQRDLHGQRLVIVP